MHTTRTLAVICLPFVSALAACCACACVCAAEPATTAAYRIELADPVTPAESAQAYTVVQTRDGSGFPTGYRMSFDTPVCIDEQCRIVSCTMYWNALGYYERLEYPADTPLTKKKHVPFEAHDYARLDQILKDRTSVLGKISLESLAPPTAKGVDPADPPPDELGLDGWSGATPSAVRQAVVDDAAYTSWAMWRWANGEIVPKLQDLTRKSCTAEYLRRLLQSDDRRDVHFALNHIIAHHGNDKRFADDVFRVLETADREYVTLSLEYLADAFRDQRPQLHLRLIDACCRMKDNRSPMVLDYIAREPDLRPQTLEALSDVLDQLQYFQIHLILRLLEQSDFHSEQAESNIAALLDNDNFFIARRAYEHLAKQPVSVKMDARLRAFHEKYGDRL